MIHSDTLSQKKFFGGGAGVGIYFEKFTDKNICILYAVTHLEIIIYKYM